MASDFNIPVFLYDNNYINNGPARFHSYFDEFYEIEVFDDKNNEVEKLKNIDDILNASTYTCHVCNIDVPKTYKKEHIASKKHEACLEITHVALERTQSYMKTDSIESSIRLKVDRTYFCEHCTVIVKAEDRDKHILTRKHVNEVKNDELLQKLVNVYKDVQTDSGVEVESIEDTLEQMYSTVSGDMPSDVLDMASNNESNIASNGNNTDNTKENDDEDDEIITQTAKYETTLNEIPVETKMISIDNCRSQNENELVANNNLTKKKKKKKKVKQKKETETISEENSNTCHSQTAPDIVVKTENTDKENTIGSNNIQILENNKTEEDINKLIPKVDDMILNMKEPTGNSSADYYVVGCVDHGPCVKHNEMEKHSENNKQNVIEIQNEKETTEHEKDDQNKKDQQSETEKQTETKKQKKKNKKLKKQQQNGKDNKNEKEQQAEADTENEKGEKNNVDQLTKTKHQEDTPNENDKQNEKEKEKTDQQNGTGKENENRKQNKSNKLPEKEKQGGKKTIPKHLSDLHTYLEDFNKQHKSLKVTALTDSLLSIVPKGGEMAVVPLFNFHGYDLVGYGAVVCRICKWTGLLNPESHERDPTHIATIMKPVDRNFMRKLDGTFSHCILCNSLHLTAESPFHVTHFAHIRNRMVSQLWKEDRVAQVMATLSEHDLTDNGDVIACNSCGDVIAREMHSIQAHIESNDHILYQ